MASDPTSTDGRKRRKTLPARAVTNPNLSAANRRRYEDPAERERTSLMYKQRAARGLLGRPLGSYDGIAKADRVRVNAEAKQFAQETILKMAEQGILTDEDDPRAVKALLAAVEVMATPANQQTKLAAARLILDFTKSKPASKSEVTVNKAEEWLAAVNRSENDAEGPADNSEEAAS